MGGVGMYPCPSLSLSERRGHGYMPMPPDEKFSIAIRTCPNLRPGNRIIFMRHLISSLLIGSSLTLADIAFAAEHAIPTRAGHDEVMHAVEDSFPHPHISEDGGWAGAMVIVILLGFFLPAAVIGPIVRANTPEDVPPAHSHDEPPGTSGHHGHSGTHAEEPHH